MKTYPGTCGSVRRAAVTVEGAEKKSALSSETALFPAFARAEADESRAQQANERERQIAQHRETMKACWPEWSGPVAGGDGASGFCEVHACCVHNLTDGRTRYHYMAPCRIKSVSLDGLTLIVVVDYHRPGWAQERYNGERLRLDITEVWPPVWLLAARRRGQQETPRRATDALAVA